jgi:hypothetical protein
VGNVRIGWGGADAIQEELELVISFNSTQQLWRKYVPWRWN